MSLEFVNYTKTPVPRSYLCKWVKLISKSLPNQSLKSKVDRNEIILAFVSKAKMQSLNKSFRGKDKVTDVLSFAPVEPGSLGELVLCPEVLKKQAKEHNLTYRDEVAYMVLHGILHLLGFEHETGEKEAKKMFVLQDRIFLKIDKIK